LKQQSYLSAAGPLYGPSSNPSIGNRHGKIPWRFFVEDTMNKHQDRICRTESAFDVTGFEKINHKHKKRRSQDELDSHHKPSKHEKNSFRCIHCKQPVPICRAASGVNNRNHCPYCLTSRHVDLYKPGDRRSHCRSKMVAIGVTLKRTFKKYNGERQGELMLIHRCAGCGKLSINRIAGDDNANLIFDLFNESSRLTPTDLEQLVREGIQPLLPGDFTLVFTQLFGWEAVMEDLSSVETQKIPVDVERPRE
jgi:hypothetical protein